MKTTCCWKKNKEKKAIDVKKEIVFDGADDADQRAVESERILVFAQSYLLSSQLTLAERQVERQEGKAELAEGSFGSLTQVCCSL